MNWNFLRHSWQRLLRYAFVGTALAIPTATPPLVAATYEVAQRHPQASDDGPGTRERPWQTLAKAAASVGPGDTVLIRGGVYRERLLIKASGSSEAPIRFEAAPGEFVVLTGADRLTGWQRNDPDRPAYTIPWPHRFNTYSKTMTHPADARHLAIGRCEQVIVNGYLLRQVLSAAQLAPGTFFADVTNQVLHIWDTANGDLAKAQVEGSVRQEVLRVEGEHVRLRGIHFRFAANQAQRGAVWLAGGHGVLEDCVIEDMNSSGATFAAEHLTVRRCAFRNNGQLGFSANRAHHLRFAGCLVEQNNVKNFDRGWEAGGNKLVLCRDAVLEHSRFLRNHGNGVWFDIGNEDCSVRNCLIADNEDAGIFYEISFALRAHDNVIVGNGFASTAGAWGAQAGISLSSSPNCVIERNLVVGNREGFNFREQLRSTRTIEDRKGRPVWNHDELIRNNIIAFNRDAQIWGWFDVKDERHWPAGRQRIETDSKSKWNLENLKLRFEDNIYFAAPGQGEFRWGTTWARHRNYATLEEFRSELKIDAGSRVLDPSFADLASSDFRLNAEAPVEFQACYPRGAIPGVTLEKRE